MIVHQPPTFTSVPDPMEIAEGNEVKLQCQAKGKPVPKVTWFRNGVPVKHDAFTRLQALDDKKKLLALSTMLMKKGDIRRHDGEYTIEATNCAGTVTHTVPLTGEKSNENYTYYLQFISQL